MHLPGIPAGIWLVLLSLVPVPANSMPQNGENGVPVIPIQELTSTLLREPARFWVDKEDTDIAALPLQQFRPLTDREVNRGITDDTYWIRIRLSNAGNPRPQRWVLNHETSYLDEMTVYYADNSANLNKLVLSDREPFSSRPLDYRTLAFEHTTPENSYTDIYLRLRYVKADSMSLNVNLSRADLFYNRTRSEYHLYGIYYGVMGSLLIIALVFSALMRQRVYLYYAAFLASSILMWALLNGFAFQYLWPESIYWHNEGFHIFFLLTAITALQFSRHFLQTSRCCEHIDKIIRVFQWIMIAAILLRFAGLYTPVLYISFAALSLLVLLPWPGYLAYQHGMRYARWYSIAWLFYGVSLVFSVISAGTGLLNWGMTPLIYTQIGGVLEAIFLLIALGERLVMWDRDRLHALKIANQDPLTGLGNRRALEEAFDRLRYIPPTTGHPAFLIIIDLDNFKEINDKHGHNAGDQILINMAKILQRTTRPEDICIRYGGEEFAILLRTKSVDIAIDLAERIRKEFSETPTFYDSKAISHTLTAGITRPFFPDKKINPTEIIQQADTALYRAKKAGRNQTLVYA